MEIHLVLEKETKGAVRYKEVPKRGEEIVVGTLYVRKDALDKPYPTVLTANLEFSSKREAGAEEV